MIAHRLSTIRRADQILVIEDGRICERGTHDELIRRSIAESMVELNIGGVPAEAREAGHPQAGLYEFKQGFGGQPMARFGLDMPLGEIDR